MLSLSIITQNNKEIREWLLAHLHNLGFESDTSKLFAAILMVLALALASFAMAVLVRQILKTLLQKSAKTKHNLFPEALLKNNFHNYVSWLAPYIIFVNSMDVVALLFSAGLLVVIEKALFVALVYFVLRIILAFINAAFDSLRNQPNYHDKPINSYRQVFKIFVVIVGVVVIFSAITGQSPYKFFAAMGAASAILLLMFKDVIMGFVASVQVTTNDMVRIGDWITMPKYGADGDVIEITLTTVKIQNFDKTISTIPTYALISDSFQNWRGVISSGGRRIKRALYIKQNSIRFIHDNEIERFRNIERIRDYIDAKKSEIDAHNNNIGADKSFLINGRNLTNIGLFRKYIELYLTNHPSINQDMILMVRQLAPTETGMPLEIYAFTNTTKWVKYEYIMADIIDHIIAAVGYFDLQIFERPSNSDNCK